jgi:regulator of protease activity HflC (stomatin/prohibitin superfamily)
MSSASMCPADPRVGARHLTMIERNRSTVVMEAVVENHEAGLLYVEGRLVERLAPGRHAFWTVGRKIEVKRLDCGPQAVEITAQEMLTKDRIALRVTLTGFRRIVDPERGSRSVPGRGCVAVPPGAVRDPRGGGGPHARRGALGQGALDAELRDYVRERVARAASR